MHMSPRPLTEHLQATLLQARLTNFSAVSNQRGLWRQHAKNPQETTGRQASVGDVFTATLTTSPTSTHPLSSSYPHPHLFFLSLQHKLLHAARSEPPLSDWHARGGSEPNRHAQVYALHANPVVIIMDERDNNMTQTWRRHTAVQAARLHPSPHVISISPGTAEDPFRFHDDLISVSRAVRLLIQVWGQDMHLWSSQYQCANLNKEDIPQQ